MTPLEVVGWAIAAVVCVVATCFTIVVIASTIQQIRKKGSL